MSEMNKELITNVLHLISLHHDCGLFDRMEKWGEHCPSCKEGNGMEIIERLNEILDPKYRRLCRICGHPIEPGDELDDFFRHRWHIPCVNIK